MLNLAKYYINHKIHNTTQTADKFVDIIRSQNIVVIKFFQSISTRPDLLDQKICHSICKNLLNNCQSHSSDITKHIFEQECPELSPPTTIIGIGSMAQVYQWDDVTVVKILHPNIKHDIDNARMISKYIPETLRRSYNFFITNIEKQLDLKLEREMMMKYNQMITEFKLDNIINIPICFDYTNNTLWMTFVGGTTMYTHDRNIDVYYRLCLIYVHILSIYGGIINCDLHGGNWMIDKPNISIIDYGFCMDITNIPLSERKELCIGFLLQDTTKIFKYIVDSPNNPTLINQILLETQKYSDFNKCIQKIIKKYLKYIPEKYIIILYSMIHMSAWVGLNTAKPTIPLLYQSLQIVPHFKYIFDIIFSSN